MMFLKEEDERQARRGGEMKAKGRRRQRAGGEGISGERRIKRKEVLELQMREQEKWETE